MELENQDFRILALYYFANNFENPISFNRIALNKTMEQEPIQHLAVIRELSRKVVKIYRLSGYLS